MTTRRIDALITGIPAVVLSVGAFATWWLAGHGQPDAINGAFGMGICAALCWVGFLMVMLP